MSDELTHLRSANSGLRKIVAKQHDEIERLRDLLAFNHINPDGLVESAKGAARKRYKG